MDVGQGSPEALCTEDALKGQLNLKWEHGFISCAHGILFQLCQHFDLPHLVLDRLLAKESRLYPSDLQSAV